MPPDPLPTLATYGARIYTLCASNQSQQTLTRCYSPEYRSKLFSLCAKVHNYNAERIIKFN